MADYLASKDPRNIEPYFVVWCDPYGSNYSGDDGELQSAIIQSSSWTMPTGTLVKVSDNLNAITIAGVAYPANTVATIWLASGTAGENYSIVNTIVTNDGRTLDWTMVIPVREH